MAALLTGVLSMEHVAPSFNCSMGPAPGSQASSRLIILSVVAENLTAVNTVHTLKTNFYA